MKHCRKMRAWDIPRMWDGGECWIIGGGSSIPHEFGVPKKTISKVQTGEVSVDAFSPFLSPIHDKHIIAINAAYQLGTWMDVVFFGDSGFFWKNKEGLLSLGKPLVTSNANLFPRVDHFGIKYTPEDKKRPKGISSRPGHVSWNLNSGAAAISLAHQFGVKRIYLLGFDMCLNGEGTKHFHRVYKDYDIPVQKNPRNIRKQVPKRTFSRHLPGFKFVAQDAKRLGLEIINVSQQSVITQFEKQTIKEILG